MKIAIIGGGITGLTTALALHKLGLSCEVYERASELNEVGAGIWMAPNAMKVLNWLGIGDEIRENGIELQKVELTNSSLEPLRRSRHEFISDTEGNRIVSIHRAKLQSILFRHLPAGIVHLNKEFVACEEREDDILIRFQDSEITTSIVLGADGLWSKVRAMIVPDSTIRYSGQTCWRGVTHIELPLEFRSSCIEAWGRRIRFGFSVIGKGNVYWYAVAVAPEGERDEAPGRKQRLCDLFGSFSPLVNRIIQHTPDEKIIRSDIHDLKRLPTWSKGRICLSGDAGHATTPNMGQGGAQGIEDAWYISHILAGISDYKEAFRAFERVRRKKVDSIVTRSWMLGKMIHDPVGQALLRVLNRLMSDRVLRKQTERLWEVGG